jgi:hypothetical protein
MGKESRVPAADSRTMPATKSSANCAVLLMPSSILQQVLVKPASPRASAAHVAPQEPL